MTAAVATPPQGGPARLLGDTRYLRLAYDELLRDATRDETWGIAFLAGVAERRPFAPHEQAFIGVLVAMERGMQALLVRLLRRRGLAWDEASAAADASLAGRQLADRYGVLSWRELLQQAIADPAPPYLSKYRRLRELAPPGDHEVLDLLVEHERALLDVAALELTLMNESALAPMWRCLEKAQALLRRDGAATPTGAAQEAADE